MTPRLADLFAAAAAQLARTLRVAGPAEVLSYDKDKQRATVHPLIKDGYYDENGVRQTSRPQPITNVPVVFMSTASGFRLTVPIEPGDTVLVIYADRSLDQWAQRGGAVDPLDDRAHRPDDAIAIPSLRDFAHAIDEVSDNPSIGFPDALVEFTETQIQAGGTSALALQSDLVALRNYIATIFVGGTGSVIATPPSVGTGTAVLKGG